jgi:hypothetical protein
VAGGPKQAFSSQLTRGGLIYLSTMGRLRRQGYRQSTTVVPHRLPDPRSPKTTIDRTRPRLRAGGGCPHTNLQHQRRRNAPSRSNLIPTTELPVASLQEEEHDRDKDKDNMYNTQEHGQQDPVTGHRARHTRLCGAYSRGSTSTREHRMYLTGGCFSETFWAPFLVAVVVAVM